MGGRPSTAGRPDSTAPRSSHRTATYLRSSSTHASTCAPTSTAAATRTDCVFFAKSLPQSALKSGRDFVIGLRVSVERRDRERTHPRRGRSDPARRSTPTARSTTSAWSPDRRRLSPAPITSSPPMSMPDRLHRTAGCAGEDRQSAFRSWSPGGSTSRTKANRSSRPVRPTLSP